MWWRSSWGSGQVPLVLLASLLESRDSIEGAWDLTTDERRDGEASTSSDRPSLKATIARLKDREISVTRSSGSVLP